ncbi:MAG: hypothetical protein QM621_10875 [Aeromicrobium sp.]|uniref:hypothetical protein n=1 Tax=Aeromicrobium sp. TaxID=1871063 RepID=UPI0039E21B54
MPAISDEDATQIRDRIMRLTAGPISTQDVTVTQGDGPDGEGVVVTVRIQDDGVGDMFDPESFFVIRHEARAIVYEVIGDKHRFRVSYTADPEGR